MSIAQKYHRELVFLKKTGAVEYFTKRLPKFIKERLVPRQQKPGRKHEMLRNFQERFGCTTLIETGTYLGDTTYALANRFRRIYSVELDPALAKLAQKRFIKSPHITIYQGDSGKILPQILQKISERCLFWLDSHYSEGITARGAIDTPIADELTAIFSHPIKNHVVLIDDAREFNGTNGYPTIEKLEEYVRKENQNYIIETEKDIIRIYPKDV